MPRDLNARESGRKARARRQFALDRRELRQPSAQRAPASGPTSMAVKINPDAAAIERFLASKGRDK